MLRKLILGLLLIILVIFIVYSPKLDQYLALIPYDFHTSKFYGETHLWCKLVYYSIPVITVLFIVIPLWFLWKSLRTPDAKPIRKVAIAVLLSLALGPGLVVNTIFKDNWGRPRPYQVIRDGKIFTPVWRANVNQPKNNSFPCGHASMGFFLGVPFLVLGYRKKALLIGLVGGGFVGAVRMLQGGHYLSDVVFCGVFVWLIAELVVYIVNRGIKLSE